MQTFKITNNLDIPVLGFGTYQLNSSEAYDAVLKALEVGYRHIDCAERYGNQKDVGRAIADSEITRDDIFVTSKVWRDNLHTQEVLNHCESTLNDLRLDYLDLYLIHWPNKDVPVAETLGAMQNLLQQGKIKAIGVSNFAIHHIKDAIKAGVEIVCDQIEFHPTFYPIELTEYCRQHGMAVTAYSPLAQGHDLKLPLVERLASQYRVSESQIILAWIRSKGIVAIPRSANHKYIEDNFESQNIELAPEDIVQMDSLHENYRVIDPPFGEFDY